MDNTNPMDNTNSINNINIKNMDKKKKIIMVGDNNNHGNKSKFTNDNISYGNLSLDNISESNNDELDKEFKKILC